MKIAQLRIVPRQLPPNSKQIYSTVQRIEG